MATCSIFLFLKNTNKLQANSLMYVQKCKKFFGKFQPRSVILIMSFLCLEPAPYLTKADPKHWVIQSSAVGFVSMRLYYYY